MSEICNWLALVCFCATAAVQVACPHLRAAEPGIVTREPESGRSVRVPSGCMVAYEHKIPGTDVTFFIEPIPRGVFTQGSPPTEESRNQDEGPAVDVEVTSFWMGRREVTWAQYKQFMQLCSVFERFDDRDIRQVTKANQIDATRLRRSSMTRVSHSCLEKIPICLRFR